MKPCQNIVQQISERFWQSKKKAQPSSAKSTTENYINSNLHSKKVGFKVGYVHVSGTSQNRFQPSQPDIIGDVDWPRLPSRVQCVLSGHESIKLQSRLKYSSPLIQLFGLYRKGDERQNPIKKAEPSRLVPRSKSSGKRQENGRQITLWGESKKTTAVTSKWKGAIPIGRGQPKQSKTGHGLVTTALTQHQCHLLVQRLSQKFLLRNPINACNHLPVVSEHPFPPPPKK